MFNTLRTTRKSYFWGHDIFYFATGGKTQLSARDKSYNGISIPSWQIVESFAKYFNCLYLVPSLIVIRTSAASGGHKLDFFKSLLTLCWFYY